MAAHLRVKTLCAALLRFLGDKRNIWVIDRGTKDMKPKTTETITRRRNRSRSIQPGFSSEDKVASAILAVVGSEDNFEGVSDHPSALDLAAGSWPDDTLAEVDLHPASLDLGLPEKIADREKVGALTRLHPPWLS